MIGKLFLIIMLCYGIALSQSGEVIYVPGSTVKICQLVGDYDRERQTPTQNLTDTRYHLWGTDLGVPFSHYGRIFLLFGDTIGPPGGDAIAYTTDLNPEDGLELTFIHDSNGTYKPVQIPGIDQADYHVPMEGVSVGGRMYIYHTTKNENVPNMGRSIVAVSDDFGESFEYLYDFSGKYFINVSVVLVDLAQWNGFPQQSGQGLVIFGSGKFRQSDVRLAFQPADSINTPHSLRYFTGLDNTGRPRWSPYEEEATALFSQSCVGELSVSYNRFLHKWLMLYNCDNPRGINFRTADQPWGPWSKPQVLFDPWRDNGYCHFIHTSWQFKKCDQVHDPGRENEWGGEYGPYQFEDLAIGNDSTTTIYFTMSTWNPYTVVLMKSTLKLKQTPTLIRRNSGILPTEFSLHQNYPNPFNPSTTIEFTIPDQGRVTLKIFNLQGKEIVTLVNEYLSPGQYSTTWYPKQLPSGVYYYRLVFEGRTRTFKTTRKLLFIK